MEHITTPSIPDQSKVGQREIHGLVIPITTRMPSSTFIRPRPFDHKLQGSRCQVGRKAARRRTHRSIQRKRSHP
ncbi:hypothetical protein DY000_02006794 [Brassica cretica]|uniref:Uncharacterized protein n=1 Tax=Brassica cretica TaxID=69181 RepID=A0ABQ7CNE4_BRACR|nr:hypothetical protein DY000_02006794 [Brassica cretica]